MRASRVFHAVDSHTEGMPTRVITGGVGVLPGDTMLERKLRFERERDWIRTLLMHEPRGHGAMSGAILQPPCRDDADWGVVYIEVSGCLPMCGHGTIGVATVLVETGMVEVREPETVVRLDVPAGLVEARVQVEDGRAKSVSLRNVPSFLHATDAEAGGVRYDMAYGGNFYAIADAASAGLEVRPEHAEELVEAGLAFDENDRFGSEPFGHRHPSRLGRPLALRHGHECADGTALVPRRAGARRAVRERGDHRHSLHWPPARGDDRRRPARRGAGDHRPRLDHRHGAVPARSRGSVPARLPCRLTPLS